jgi:hypothetical protein
MSGMSDDELRTRLSRIDPAPAGDPVDPGTGPQARELMERAMSTPAQTPDSTFAPHSRRRGPWLLAAAGAAAAAVVAGFLVLGGDDDRVGGNEAPATLALSLPPADVAASCVQFDVQFLAEMPVALAGTVTGIGADEVTLDVDRWYRGGAADVVTIAVPVDSSAALDGVDFRIGERYLVTATGGTVNGCGFSGPADADLERAFEQAFAG